MRPPIDSVTEEADQTQMFLFEHILGDVSCWKLSAEKYIFASSKNNLNKKIMLQKDTFGSSQLQQVIVGSSNKATEIHILKNANKQEHMKSAYVDTIQRFGVSVNRYSIVYGVVLKKKTKCNRRENERNQRRKKRL